MTKDSQVLTILTNVQVSAPSMHLVVGYDVAYLPLWNRYAVELESGPCIRGSCVLLLSSICLIRFILNGPGSQNAEMKKVGSEK